MRFAPTVMRKPSSRNASVRAQSASVAGATLAESKHQRRAEPNHLPKDAPNIVIILLDDVGFGAASTFGGPIDTPTLQRLSDSGLRYDRFHTTAVCSPTRAALLTGRNHHILLQSQVNPGVQGPWWVLR